jgi:hypothetical protein
MLRVELEVPSGVTHNADGGVDRVGRTVVVSGRQRLRCALIGHPVLRDLPGTSSQRQHLLDGIGVHLHRPEPTDRSVRTDWVLRVRLAVGHAVAETVGPQVVEDAARTPRQSAVAVVLLEAGDDVGEDRLLPPAARLPARTCSAGSRTHQAPPASELALALSGLPPLSSPAPVPKPGRASVGGPSRVLISAPSRLCRLGGCG